MSEAKKAGVYKLTGGWPGRGTTVHDRPDLWSRNLGTLKHDEEFEIIDFQRMGKWGQVGGIHPLAGGWAELNDWAERIGDIRVEPLLLTLHVGNANPSGLVDVTATSMAGDEVAQVKVDFGKQVHTLRDAMVQELDLAQPITFMLPNGTMLTDDFALIGEVLTGAGAST